MSRTASCFVLTLALAGLCGCRGGISSSPPVHPVLDMDFQPKLKAQSESTFAGFSDHRGMRMPVAHTVARGGNPGGALERGTYWLPSADEVFAAYDRDGDNELDRLESRPLQVSRVLALADTDHNDRLDRDEVGAIAKLWVHKNADGSFVTENPLPKSAEVLARGRERFNIHCAVCHGQHGKGGLVAKRWPVPVPDLVEHADPTTRVRLTGLSFGELFDTITKGKGKMPSYAQQIRVEDRWAIAHYLKALQQHFSN